MYNLDTKKLLKATSGNFAHFTAIRWCLDYMFTVKGEHTVSIDILKKEWAFKECPLEDEVFKVAPEFLTVIIKDDDLFAFSRPIKSYLEQERILKQLGQRVDVEDVSAKGKIKEQQYKEVEVFCDKSGMATSNYSGLFPTRSYNHNREVFCITGVFYSYLKAKYENVDVDEKLKEVHIYLSTTEAARRHHSSMKRYIEAWVSGDLLKLNKLRKKKEQVSKAKFYEEFIRDE